MVTDQNRHIHREGNPAPVGSRAPKPDYHLVSATGLNLAILGEAEFSVDGQAVDLSRHGSYKGLMYSDVPNLIATFGYINASWTLRADLTSEYACRLLNHMDARGAKQVTAEAATGGREHAGAAVDRWLFVRLRACARWTGSRARARPRAVGKSAETTAATKR
jgi:cation diffusion facilitator CzcD-associated flavoprotein CzcO